MDDLMSVVRAVGEISAVTNTRLEPTLGRHRLTFQTAKALWAIDPDRPAPPMREVARRLHCNASNLTFIARQLEDRGYLTRHKDPQDGRSCVLRLTADGERARSAVIAAALEATPFAALPAEQLRDLAATLNRVADGDRREPG